MKTFEDKFVTASYQKILDLAKENGGVFNPSVRANILIQLKIMYDRGYGEGRNDCMIELSEAD